MSGRPLIGIPACVKEVDGLPFHAVGEKYITAVADAAGGLPWLIPALGGFYDIPDLVARMDGLLVTGSRSNVARTSSSARSRSAFLSKSFLLAG